MTTETTESPRSLGRYELVHLLGQGGMGEVYLAKISGAAGFEKPCIVKTILPALMKDRQFLDRFHHEAKVLVHLVHSSIAQVYDMGEALGTYFMALEYVAGVDVAYLADQARTQNRSIPVPVVLYLGQKVAEGLGYAHRKAGPDGAPLGIVHRDVSPHNVMVSYEGEVKVIDFGLAKSAARSKYTLPSTVMGKLGYMSPEQARAEPLDHRSDIYSCAVMVWELFAGQPLIPHGTMGEMMAAMANPRVPSLHELRPEVDPALDAVVRKALEPNPQNRYARADDFARALNEQLLRSSTSLGAEEVGNFVKATCPESFAAQRKLISRISAVRRSPSVPPSGGMLQVGVSPLPAGADPYAELGATSVRAPSGTQDMAFGATLRPMVTPQSGSIAPAAVPAQEFAPAPAPSGPAVPAQVTAPLAVAQSGVVAPPSRLSRSTVVGGILFLFVLMIGTAVATAHFLRPPPPPSIAGQMGEPPDRGPWPDPRHPGDPRPPHDRPPHDRPPHDRPPPVDAAPEGDGKQAGLPSEVVPAAGSKAAAAVPAVAAVGSVSVAHAVGAEPSTPKDEPEEAEPTPKPQAGTSKPREPKGAELPAPKGLIPVEQKNGQTLATGPAGAELRKGMVVKVMRRKSDGKLKEVGTATVLGRVHSGKAMKLDLDAAASGARGPFFVIPPDPSELAQAVEPQPAPPAPQAPAPPPPTPAPPARRQLNLFVRETGMIDKEYDILNKESEALSNCSATVNGKLRAGLKSLRTDKATRIDKGAFKRNVTAPDVPKGRMIIECNEGSADVGIRG